MVEDIVERVVQVLLRRDARRRHIGVQQLLGTRIMLRGVVWHSLDRLLPQIESGDSLYF